VEVGEIQRSLNQKLGLKFLKAVDFVLRFILLIKSKNLNLKFVLSIFITNLNAKSTALKRFELQVKNKINKITIQTNGCVCDT
jgi:uncharacterized Rmd1/YagE family protein